MISGRKGRPSAENAAPAEEEHPSEGSPERRDRGIGGKTEPEMKNASGACRSAPRAGGRQPGEPRRPQEDPRDAFAVRQLPALVKHGYRLGYRRMSHAP
ncbi:hypothetical protein MRX96_058179 [Rhipicephalus microplus]